MLTVQCKSLPLLTATVPTEDPSCPFSDFHSKSQKKKKGKKERHANVACCANQTSSAWLDVFTGCNPGYLTDWVISYFKVLIDYPGLTALQHLDKVGHCCTSPAFVLTTTQFKSLVCNGPVAKIASHTKRKPLHLLRLSTR